MERSSFSGSSKLSARRLAVDGLVANAALAGLVTASLRLDPMIWYGDYPEAMKEKAGPQTRRGRYLSYVLIGPLLGLFFGALAVSNLKLKAENGGRLSFRTALLNAYVLFTLINLFDTVVIDYLWLTKRPPKWAFLPGTEDMNMADYAPPKEHVRNFVKGSVIGLIAALPVAFFTRSK